MRLPAALSSLLLICVAAGCSSAEGAGTTTTTTDSTAPLPPEICPAGTMPSLASGGCDPVGTTTCGAGFAAAADGWGCAAILPEATCTGTTRASLGATSCVAVDDCSRAFPPAGAKVVTDDASLAAALGSARSGDTIALDAGTYGGFEVPTDLHIVGRCADQVIVQGTGDRGVFVTGAKTVSIESITVSGFAGGVVASWYSTVDASRVIVKGSQVAFTGGGSTFHVTGSVAETTATGTSAITGQGAAAILVEDSDIRGYETAISSYEQGTSITLKNSVARYDGTNASSTKIFALGGSHTIVDGSAFRWRTGPLAFVARDLPDITTLADQVGGILEIKNSDIRHSGAELNDTLVKVDDTATFSLDNTTLEHQAVAAVMVGAPGSTVTTAHSVIRNAAITDQMRNAIWAIRGGAATIDTTAIIGAQQNALIATSDGTTMTVTHSLVQSTAPGTEMVDQDLGACGMALLVGANAVASVSDSAFVGSTNLAVLASEGAQVQLARSIVDATSASPENLGGSAICAESSVLTIDQSLVRKSQAAAFVFMGGNAIVKNSHFVANHVGVQLADGTMVNATSDPTTADDGVVVMFDNVFESTDAMVSHDPYSPPGMPE